MEVDCLKYVVRIKIQEAPSDFLEIIFKNQKDFPTHEFIYCSFEDGSNYKEELRKYIFENFGKDFNYIVVGVQKHIKVCRCEIAGITSEQIYTLHEMYELER